MGKVTHLSFPLGFFPQATTLLSSHTQTDGIAPWSSQRIRVGGQRATCEPLVNSTLFMVALRYERVR